MRILNLLMALVLLSVAFAVQARQGEPPRSWAEPELRALETVEQRTFQAIDARALRATGNKNVKEGQPLQVAVPHDLDLAPGRHGTWREHSDGGRIWQVVLRVPGATDMRAGFDRFRLPEGATLHAWTPEDDYFQGPYTAADNKSHGQLWLPVIPGDTLVVELYVPERTTMEPVLEMARVGGGFRDYFGRDGGPYLRGGQGACNNDVVCPEGDPWSDEIRSVAVYERSGVWACTGTLINDVETSLTPHFLTAAHCGVTSSSAPSMVVYWNFESPNCGDLSGGSLDDNQTGATHLASRSDVDVTLVELDVEPDEGFEVHYSGWDRTGNVPNGAVGIHHPSTAEKAISFALSELDIDQSCIGGSTPDSHWFVPFWDDGTTEPGSSGSGLWDPDNHRLVGFLSGGLAACGNQEYDCYGRFDLAWDGDSSGERLRDWLDPQDTQPPGVDGTDPTGFSITADTTDPSVCLPDDAVVDLDLAQAGDFDDPVDLDLEDLPAGAGFQFDPNPVTPPGSSQLSLTDLDAAGPGSYALTVTGTSPEQSRELPLQLTVADDDPGVPAVTGPTDGATSVSTSPQITWDGAEQAAQYTVEIATDSGFSDIVYSAQATGTSHQVDSSLAPDSTHYVRVRAANACGTGDNSPASSFTTALEICMNPAESIPDGDPAGTTVDTQISAELALDVLEVGLDITHTWVGDLIVELEHVDTGTTITLVDRPGYDGSGFGCSGSNMDIILTDGASLSVEDDCSDDGEAYEAGERYQPVEALDGFSGENLQGTWELTVSDNAGQDTGTLNSWCMLPIVLEELLFADGFESP